MVDPSGEAATISRLARGCRGTLRRDPRHARPLRPHRQPRRPRRADGRAGLRSRRRAAAAGGARAGSRCRGSRSRPTTADVWLAGRRDASRRRACRSRSCRYPATRRRISRTSPTASSSRATSFSPDRSAAPTFREPTGTRSRRRSRRCWTPIQPTTVVHPGHGPQTTLGAELAGNPFLVRLRASRTAP